jgi:MFS family permease
MAQLVSLFGDQLYWMVFLFLANEVSRHKWEVGLVMTAQAVPFLLLGPAAGVIADRFDRRRIMAVANFASASITLLLAGLAYFQPYPPIWALASVAFTLSCVNAFFMPARMAALPRLVPESQLAEANGVVITLQQLVSMLGIAFSALILGAIFDNFPGAFLMLAALLNSLTFAIGGWLVLRLPNLSPEKDPDHVPHGWNEFKEGVRVVFRDPVLRFILPANVLSQCFISGFMVIYVVVNDAWFGGRYSTFAWIEFSFAACVAAMGLAVARIKVPRPGLAFALATSFIGLTVLAMGWAENVWLFILWNALAGLALPFAWLPIQVYVQSAFHDKVRGRVSSAWVSTQMGVQPVGLMGIGPLIDGLGIRGAFVVMGGGMALAGVLGLASKETRQGRMPEAAQAE